MVVWVVVVFCWLAVAVSIPTGMARRVADALGTVDVDPGGSAQVSGNDEHYLVNCNDGHLSVGGNSITAVVRGHCASLEVSGNDNTVTVDSADAISARGIDGRVTYHDGTPQITNSGIDCVVERG